MPAPVLLLLAILVWSGSEPPRQAQPPSDDAVVADFARRLDEYATLHRQLEGPVPTINVSSDPLEIRRAVDALGAKIRRARAAARRGDIFAADIAAMMRARILNACAGDVDAVHAVAHDETAPMPPARVNGKWPGPEFTVMPTGVLCRLPTLPEELEYRFVNRDLVLWDVHADVIVDILPGALRKPAHGQ
jgi:hypothetical protein